MPESNNISQLASASFTIDEKRLVQKCQSTYFKPLARPNSIETSRQKVPMEYRLFKAW